MLVNSHLLVDLSGSPYLCVGSPCPDAESPAGREAACAHPVSCPLVEDTGPPGSDLLA